MSFLKALFLLFLIILLIGTDSLFAFINLSSDSMEYVFISSTPPKLKSKDMDKLFGWKVPMRHFTTDDGLVFSEVIVGFQDSLNGYLWFGTYRGLSRFDGKIFKNYTEKNSGLGGSVIHDIIEDSEKNIWVAYSGGIARLDGSNFLNYTEKDGLLGSDAINLLADFKKGIWVVTERGVSYFNGEKFTSYPVDGINSNYFCPKIACTKNGDIFVVTEKGLLYKKPEHSKFKAFPKISFFIKGVLYNFQEDILYFIDNKKLYQLKEKKLTVLAESPLEDSITAFRMGSNNSIWLNSDTMLWHWTLNSEKIYSSKMLNDIIISDVIEDREGNIWLTEWSNGISMLFNNTKIVNHTNLPFSTMTCIVKDPNDNTLWISGERGIFKMNKYGKILRRIQSGFVENIILEQGKIYSASTGLYQYDLQGNDIKTLNQNIDFTYILKDTHGKFWLSSYDGLFSMADDLMTLEINNSKGLGSNNVWTLMEDKAGSFWVGTENGLSCFSNGTWKHFNKDDGLSHNSIWHLYEHKEWGLLIASSYGITQWKDNKFKTLPFLSNKFILSLAVDSAGKLWAGTNEGVFRINTKGQIDISINKLKGMASDSVYLHAMLIDEPYIYIGTDNGLSRIELDIINNKNISPMLDINQVNINHKPVDMAFLNKPLKHFQNNYKFHFNAIYTYLPDSILYSCFLEGMDEKWSDKSPLRLAIYTNLSPGSYTFKVRAFAENNKKSPIKTINFIIQKPFWLRWWFIALEGVIILISIILISYFVSQMRLKKRLAIELIENELNIARKIQHGILPDSSKISNYKEFDVYAILQTAKAVGGDLYDFFFVDKKHLCFVLGDVSDKGIPAAIFMAITRTIIKSSAHKNFSPAAMMSHVNNFLCKNNPNDMFVTLIIGILNISSGEIYYANAGHNPPVIISQSIFYKKDISGPFAGVFTKIKYKNLSHKLSPGDAIFLYTDGITEAMNKEKNEFSEKRLLFEIKKLKDISIDHIVSNILLKVKIHAGSEPQSDDIAVLMLKYHGTS
ncbi:phosphoserine phosphatase RsbU/P [Candidatus Magnetomoraceae bacterium gMMP-15]